MCHTWLRSVGISSSIIIILYLHELHFNSKNLKIFELKHFVLGKIKKLMYNQITLNKTTQNLSYHLYENLYLPPFTWYNKKKKSCVLYFWMKWNDCNLLINVWRRNGVKQTLTCTDSHLCYIYWRVWCEFVFTYL